MPSYLPFTSCRLYSGNFHRALCFPYAFKPNKRTTTYFNCFLTTESFYSNSKWLLLGRSLWPVGCICWRFFYVTIKVVSSSHPFHNSLPSIPCFIFLLLQLSLFHFIFCVCEAKLGIRHHPPVTTKRTLCPRKVHKLKRGVAWRNFAQKIRSERKEFLKTLWEVWGICQNRQQQNNPSFSFCFFSDTAYRCIYLKKKARDF